MRKLFLTLLALLTLTMVMGEELNYPIKTVDGKRYYVYNVQKSEGYYAISKRFQVTIKSIVDVNGDGGLKLGQELLIPINEEIIKNKEEIIVDNKENITANPVKKEEIAVEEVKVEEEKVEEEEKFDKKAERSVRIAVLMPFNIANFNENTDEKFVDFYRGCLLAADSLKTSGYEITIDAYDIGKSKESLTNALKNSTLKEADIIVGPAYSAQVPYVADFAAKNGIKTVIPFSNNVPQVKTNKYLFQVVCQQQDLYGSVIDECVKEWKEKRVLIIRPDSAGIRYDKKTFSDMLSAELAKNNIYCKYINAEHVAAEVNAETEKDSAQFILVIPTTNNVKLTQISDRYDAIKTNRVTVFGFPEWNDMLHKDLYGKPLCIFTNHYLDFADAETIKFFKHYYQLFGIPPVQNNPSYAVFGFDITLFFGKAFCHSGDHFEQYLDSEDGDMLQMNFAFEKINGGGYANHGIYLIRN